MTTLTERAARRMARRALDGLLEPHLSREVDAMWPALAEDAEEAIRETLDALCEPSEGMVRAYWNARDPDRMWPWHTERLEDRIGPVLDAFAREHGLAPPPAEEQRP